MPEKTRDIKKDGNDWRPLSTLFSPTPFDVKNTLELWPDVLKKVWPLSRARQKTLPRDIAHLSELLTSQREELSSSYWNRPAFISAYLYYFLPWNLLRLTQLLPNLPLTNPASINSPLLLDVGSGPMTLPIALWLAFPDWRKLSINILALDSRKQPLELGSKLMAELAAIQRESVWKIHLAHSPIFKLANDAEHLLKNHTPWLITSINVLNELIQHGRIKQSRHHSQNFDDESDLPDANNGMEALLQRMLAAWAPLAPYKPQLFFVEPGTRLGGITMMNLRKLAVEQGLIPLSPCTHKRKCPLLSRLKAHNRGYWCHFTFAAQGVPGWLEELSLRAGLHKANLSLSFILLCNPASIHYAPAERNKTIQARVLSQPFKIPALPGEARYACAKNGVVVLEDSNRVPSGSLVEGRTTCATDPRSGAPILEPVYNRVKGKCHERH